MFKTIGAVLAILVIGTLAIAWSHRSGQTTVIPANTIAPNELLANHGSLPQQEIHDRTFVFPEN